MTTYEPVIDRPPLKWPGGARIAIHTVVNIEYFQPGIPATSINPGFANLVPDVYNHSWRDYGVRAGIWRLMRILDRYQVKATVALNGMVCRHYPKIVAEVAKRGWECMGHGMTNSQMLGKMSIDEERGVIKATLDTIEQSTGRRPRGWLGPALAESWNTPALLEEAGVSYVCDWLNDDEPYTMNTPGRALISVPYSGEINDIHCFLRAGYQGPDYLQALKDQFDVLYEESAERPAVMAIPLHPFIVGHPFRAKYLDQALKYIAEKPGAWFATGSEIAQAYAAGAKA
jgi:peptidoglycan/xylan/chitin deacetylase (PgdA/CDA1 family)